MFTIPLRLSCKTGFHARFPVSTKILNHCASGYKSEKSKILSAKFWHTRFKTPANILQTKLKTRRIWDLNIFQFVLKEKENKRSKEKSYKIILFYFLIPDHTKIGKWACYRYLSDNDDKQTHEHIKDNYQIKSLGMMAIIWRILYVSTCILFRYRVSQ